MKIFNQKNLFSSTVIASSLIGLLSVTSCSTEEIDRENDLNSVNQAFSAPETGIIYTIENRNSGRIMEIANGSNSDGANLRQSGRDATPTETHRMWEIINTDSGFIRIRSIDSRKSIEVEDGRNADETNVEQRSYGGETHQQWEILPTSNGYFRIRSRDSRKSIGVDGASRSNGANIEIGSWNGDDRFQWRFLEVDSPQVSSPSNNNEAEDIVEETIREVVQAVVVESNDEEEIIIEEVVTKVMEEEIIQEMMEEQVADQQVIVNMVQNIIEEEVSVNNANGDFGLNPNLEPWENFDLSDWALDSPAERSNDRCRSVRIEEDEYDEIPGSPTRPYFFTHSDGGMRFVSPVGGATTNSRCDRGFPRSELREQLRAGNTSISTTGANRNNWALGYQPSNSAHGGRNGRLAATLRINQVTSTGDGLHPGRTIIGQIHASDDEPARLYYRKCPDAEFGSIYLEHEINGGSDVTFNLIGSERCSDNGPSNGIRLGELFSYEIINEGADITVNIIRGDQDGEVIASVTVDMDEENSGYDERNEWNYFKAGLYTQNNTGDDDDTDIATFYRLSNSHDNN